MSVKLSNLEMTFGKVTALDIEALEIETGQSVTLVGPNGAGKSTLLMILAGLVQPTSGSALIDGAKPGSASTLANVSFAPDQPALFDDLTLEDQLTYVARLHKTHLEDAACQQLIGDLDAHDILTKFPRAMSKGQRQKASLLIATARPFTVLLLDEPTTALDRESRTALVGALQALASNAITVISSTHDEELIAAADTQVHLDRGQLVGEHDESSPLSPRDGRSEP